MWTWYGALQHHTLMLEHTVSTFLSECDLLAEQLRQRSTAHDERMAIPNVRAAVVATGCLIVFATTAVVW